VVFACMFAEKSEEFTVFLSTEGHHGLNTRGAWFEAPKNRSKSVAVMTVYNPLTEEHRVVMILPAEQLIQFFGMDQILVLSVL